MSCHASPVHAFMSFVLALPVVVVRSFGLCVAAAVASKCDPVDCCSCSGEPRDSRPALLCEAALCHRWCALRWPLLPLRIRFLQLTPSWSLIAQRAGLASVPAGIERFERRIPFV